MQIEILTTFTETKDNKWVYSGQFLWNTQKIPLSGIIEKIESKSRLKQVLKEQVESYIKQYIIDNTPAKTITIPAGGVFVDVLT